MDGYYCKQAVRAFPWAIGLDAFLRGRVKKLNCSDLW
jgi:hypothetical protein